MASLVNQTGAAGVAAPMGSFAMASPLQKVAVYVGDLADSVTEAHLFEVFNAIGPVASVRVCRDQITRRSLGYAYVNFAKHEDADRAIEEMNFTELHGKPMRMMWSERDPSKRRSNKGNLFVKNLHESIGSKELFDTFSLIGKIKSCRVVIDAKGASRGYGFVAYEDEEAAELAVEKLNGMDVLGLQISVGPYKKPEKKAGTAWT